MTRRAPLLIDGQLFSSQEQLAREIRRRIASYENGSAFAPEDAQFFAALLRRHPQEEVKIGSGIAAFSLIQNPIYPATRTLVLLRTDGTSTDWSWRECLSPTPHHLKVKRAFRAIVAPQVIQFRAQFFANVMSTVLCPITGDEMSPTTSHVDHIPPGTFEKLFQDFLLYVGMSLADIIVLEGEDNCYQDRIADAALVEAWGPYHKDHARLRVISPYANTVLVPRQHKRDVAILTGGAR